MNWIMNLPNLLSENCKPFNLFWYFEDFFFIYKVLINKNALLNLIQWQWQWQCQWQWWLLLTHTHSQIKGSQPSASANPATESQNKRKQREYFFFSTVRICLLMQAGIKQTNRHRQAAQKIAHSHLKLLSHHHYNFKHQCYLFLGRFDYILIYSLS